ncbi:MAG: hypothetical protein EZS28_026944 [Streblomastix strix]|uniref:Uncharacterized protein n=1 Tax=Streblomastix strix TaxID=222440 RepID=A0A5J4V5F3_9EUKA|nr:MAG: hypothetical protein EZS28_026944 [Streblomastix strix]
MGAYMKSRSWIIPPGNMSASLVSSNKMKIKLERNFFETVQDTKEQQINQSQMQQNFGVPDDVDMLLLSLIRQSEAHAAVKEARTAINILFITRKHQKSKEKKRCGIWKLYQIIFAYQQKKTKRSSTQILVACMYSLIAFTNLRLLELFEEVVQKVSVAQVRLETKIWKGQQGRVRLPIRSLQNDFACPVYWFQLRKKRCTDLTDLMKKLWGRFTRSIQQNYTKPHEECWNSGRTQSYINRSSCINETALEWHQKGRNRFLVKIHQICRHSLMVL